MFELSPQQQQFISDGPPSRDPSFTAPARHHSQSAAFEDFSALCMVDAKAVLKDVSAQELVELEQRAGSSPAQEAALAVARERNPLASVEASFEQFLKQFDAEKTGPGLMVDDPFFSMSLGSGPSSGSSLADASGGPASPAGQGAAAPSMAA